MGVKPFDPQKAYNDLVPTLTEPGKGLVDVFAAMHRRMMRGAFSGVKGYRASEIPQQHHYLFHGVTAEDIDAILRAFPMSFSNLAGLQDICAAEKRKRNGLIAGWFFKGWWNFEPLLFEIVVCTPAATTAPVLEGEIHDT